MRYLLTIGLSIITTLLCFSVVQDSQKVTQQEVIAMLEQYFVNYEYQAELGSDYKLIAGFPYYLAGTGISSSATSFTLTSFTIPQTSQPIIDADLEDTFYLTIEPGNRSRQEVVGCTTVTQNGDGTATISGCSRGLSPIQPYTASTSLQFAHSGSAVVVLSNPPQLYDALYDYVNTLALGDAVAATEGVAGFVEMATQAEMSAGTATGTTGAYLSLQSQYATSSNDVAGIHIPITGSDGYLDTSFANPIEFVLFSTTTGTGNVIRETSNGSVLLKSTSTNSQAVDGTLGYVLATTTIPGGSIGTQDMLRVLLPLSLASETGTGVQYTIYVYYGSNSVSCTSGLTVSASEQTSGIVDIMIVNSSTSTSQQEVYIHRPNFGAINTNLCTGAMTTDSTVDQNFYVKLDYSSANAANDATGYGATYELVGNVE